jgi:beta-glucosidase
MGISEQSKFIVEDVHNGSISEARVRGAAARILLQKFQQGLFEQPYVDEAKAATIAGNRKFVREGQAAQAKAVVLLENKRVASTEKPLLPVAPKGKEVYLSGVAAKAAEDTGFIAVTDPAQADLAIIRALAPYESEHPHFFFGSRQHEGRLAFTEKDTAFA